jgi:hypothetical protein
MLLGIWISVNISAMSERDSRILTASVGVDRLDCGIAGVFHHVDGAHPQQHLVLDDEDDCGNGRMIENLHDKAFRERAKNGCNGC